MGRAAAFFPPDLSGIVNEVGAQNKWTDNQSRAAEDWYQHFLELNWENPGGQVYIVSGRADKLWHAHITYTRRYREYCDSCFGFYLDHTPVAVKLTAAQVKSAVGAYSRWGIVPDMLIPCAH